MITGARVITISIVLACVLAIQACAQKLSPQEGCNFIVNSQQQRVSWNNRAPVTLYIDRSVPSSFYTAIQNAANDWNRQLGHPVLQIGGVTSQASLPGRDGVNVIYWSNYWENDRPWEQARTTVAWLADQIQDADVKVNALNFRYSAADQPMLGSVDFESLMVHEFGHVLGLIHSDDQDSVMQKSLPDDYLRRVPSDYDIRSAQCEY